MNQAGDPILLAQLSDPHVVPETELFHGIDTAVSFGACLRQAQADHAKLILVSGDLMQTPTQAAYRRYFKQLESINTPTESICGNHDDPALAAEFEPDIAACRSITLGTWRLPLLNSHVACKPHDRLSQQALEWLQDQVDSAKGFILIALHHPPLPVGSPGMDCIALMNPEHLWRVLADSPKVKAVIHGHTHQVVDQWHGHIRVLGAPATSVQFTPEARQISITDEPPAYRLISLFDNGALETTIKPLNNVRLF